MIQIPVELDSAASQQSRARQVFQRFVARCRTSRAFHFENCLHIKTKDNRLVSFKLNHPQRKVQGIIDDLRARGLPVRIILLKARQEGMSTLSEANLFHSTTMNKLTNSLIVAHDTDSSYEIFSMSRLFYDMLPEGMKPMIRYSNRKELVFENPDETQKGVNPGLLSKIVVDTAKNVKIGRSFTLHHFHGSEVAFWENPDLVLLGVSQAVPDAPNTTIILESTANGLGGFFYDAYMDAKDGRSDYVAVFLAWFEMPEYAKEIVPGDWDASSFKTFGESVDEEERTLIQQYRLSLEQINWRRWAIRNKCGTGSIDEKKDKFRQEYPSNDVECFLAAGQNVFDGKLLKETYLGKVRKPVRGFIAIRDGSVRFEPSSEGPYRIWEMPTVHSSYIGGGDVAEGLEHGDASTLQIYDRVKSKVVAEYWGKCDPDLFGRECWALGMLYNEAWLAIEANNHGLTTLTTLKNGSELHGITPYRFLYYREILDERTRKRTRKFGWQTSAQSKPLMIDTLVQLVREQLIEIPGIETVRELLTFVRDEKGKMGAIPGTLDDRVIALAIATHVHSLVPVLRNYKPVHKKFADRHKRRTGY